MLNVPDFVFVNFLQKRRGFEVADFFKQIRKVQTVIEIGLLKRQTKLRNEVHRRLHRFDDPPELST